MLDTFYDKNIWEGAWTFLAIPSFQGTYVTVGAYMRLEPLWKELSFTHCSIEFPVLRQYKWLIPLPVPSLSHFYYSYASNNYLQVKFDLLREQFDTSPTLFLLVRLPCDVYLQVDHIHVCSMVSHHELVNCAANAWRAYNTCFVQEVLV